MNEDKRAYIREAYTKMPSVMGALGFDKLRPGQAPVVSSVIAGQDTICVLPTGTGKTACFLIPALTTGMKCLIFEPTVALMQDQMESLARKGLDVAQMSGLQKDSQNELAVERWARGEIQFFYVAPERMGNASFQRAMDMRKPDMVVVDEVHCMSQWSDNFRPSYAHVGGMVRDLAPRVVAAFTATMPPQVEADVRRILQVEEAVLHSYYPRRTNLHLASRDLGDITELLEYVRGTKGSCIVYCCTQRRTVETAEALSRFMNEEVGYYHGGLPPDTKRTQQRLFMSSKTRVICATNAFGMGIDKADIRHVVHMDHPGSIEHLAQEVGRAGRDGEDSWCMTFYHKDALDTQQFFLSTSFPPEDAVRRVFETLKSRQTGPDGEIRMTNDDLCRTSGVNIRQVPAAVSLLTANRVIEQAAEATRMCTIKLDMHPDSLPDDPRYGEYARAIWDIGVLDGALSDQRYDVEMDQLVERVGVGEATVKKWLKRWDEEEVIRFTPAYRGAIRKVSGDISQVDFEMFNRKRKASYAKLEDILEYHLVEDGDDKHAFIEKCFGFDEPSGEV